MAPLMSALETGAVACPKTTANKPTLPHRIDEVLIAATEAMWDDGCQLHGSRLRRPVSLSTRFLERNGALPGARPHGPLPRPRWQGCGLHRDLVPHR
jgi:hypothetical protein